MILRVLRSVVYCITENYVCVDYLGCPQNKLHVKFANKEFEK